MIRVQVTTEIPSEAIWWISQGFNGGAKSLLDATIDPSTTTHIQYATRTWSETKEYNEEQLTPTSGPSWAREIKPGEQPIKSGTLPANDSNLSLTPSTHPDDVVPYKIFISGGNPLITGPIRPKIDLDCQLLIRPRIGGGWQAKLEGSHDGFPNYRITINGKTLYYHDCVATGQTPNSLIDPLEFDISVDWTNI